MLFWASSEEDMSISNPLNQVRFAVEPHLNRQIAQSDLSDLDLEIRYIPIVMRPEWIERYPARSSARIKQRIYVCAPQLDYQIFLTGTQSEQLKEYVRGVATSLPHIHKFGLTKNQTEIFAKILDHAPAAILAETPILPDLLKTPETIAFEQRTEGLPRKIEAQSSEVIEDFGRRMQRVSSARTKFASEEDRCAAMQKLVEEFDSIAIDSHDRERRR